MSFHWSPPSNPDSHQRGTPTRGWPPRQAPATLPVHPPAGESCFSPYHLSCSPSTFKVAGGGGEEELEPLRGFAQPSAARDGSGAGCGSAAWHGHSAAPSARRLWLISPHKAHACLFHLDSSGSYQNTTASYTNSSSFSEVKNQHGNAGKCLDKTARFISWYRCDWIFQE